MARDRPPRRSRLATEPAAPCPFCPHCNARLPRTSAFEVELARNVERAIPAVLRQFYFLTPPNRKPAVLDAFGQVVRFIGAEGPPATAIMSLEREDAQLHRVGVGYVHEDPPPRVARKGS